MNKTPKKPLDIKNIKKEVLSKQEILDYFSSRKDYIFISAENGFAMNIEMRSHTNNVNALVCDNRLMGISVFPEAARALADVSNTYIATYKINSVDQDAFFDRRISWLMKKDNFKWTLDYDIKSLEHLESYIFMNSKINLLDIIYKYVHNYRKTVSNNLLAQNEIYTFKYLEAKEILDRNIQKDDTLAYPLVTGYAREKNISLQEAATIVKFKHENLISFLSENENLRIKYTNIVRQAKRLEDLRDIYSSFNSATTKYGKL